MIEYLELNENEKPHIFKYGMRVELYLEVNA